MYVLLLYKFTQYIIHLIIYMHTIGDVEFHLENFPTIIDCTQPLEKDFNMTTITPMHGVVNMGECVNKMTLIGGNRDKQLV